MKLKSIILSLITIALLASCSTSNNVVGGGIQKRKYNDGFYVSGSRKFDRKVDAQKIEFSQDEISEKQEVKVEAEELVSTFEEAIASTEISIEPKIDEINDNEKIESKHSGIAEPSELKIEETETVETADKINGTYNAKRIATVVSNSAAAESGLMLVLLVILCFILPPLAVFLVQDASTLFWVDLILWLLGWGVGYWLLGGLGGLCTLVAVIVALLVVFGVI